jgi:hypothetical protein
MINGEMVLEFMQRGSLFDVLRSEEQRKHLDKFRVFQLATDNGIFAWKIDHSSRLEIVECLGGSQLDSKDC